MYQLSIICIGPKRILGALLGLFISFAVFGQNTVNVPYNPDSDADSVIAIFDLMSVLSIYGETFVPAEITVDGVTLQEYITTLQEAAESAQSDTAFIPIIIPGTAIGQMLFSHDGVWELINPGEPGDVLTLGADSLPFWDAEEAVDCIVGCKDTSACNYNLIATINYSGLCDYLSCIGCMDSEYLEYNPSATIDDGSCATLAVEGCTDETASNFNPDANSDNGSCDYSTSGCNPVTFDGYTYDVVEIGSQCWFAENLRTTVYADGDTIPANLSDAQWPWTTSGATTVYGEGSSYCSGDCDEVANLEAYGRLYNWYTVDDSRGLCPTGWHVPTDDEWMTLEMELGMSSTEVNDSGYRGTDEGKQLKSSPQASPSWDGYHSGDPLNSGFSALPGGLRSANGYGNFNYEGSSGYWWSASAGATSFAWSRSLYSGNASVSRNYSNRRDGFSVRCVRESTIAMYGCTDPAYFEYDPSATVDNGSCATLVVEGCTDETASNFNPDANSDDGSCDYSTSGCDPVTFDGYTYDVVEIGSQCWFAENLHTSVYANGDSITDGLSNIDWVNAEEGSSTVIPNGYEYFYDTECRVYNWLAVNDVRGICPTGWHVPTDLEWMNLEETLGMTQSDLTLVGYRGTDQGKQLKSSSYWDGTNITGFSAVASGWRDGEDGDIYGSSSWSIAEWATWWTSSIATTNTNSWTRSLMSYWDNQIADDGISRGLRDIEAGYSIRCLRDEEDELILGCTNPESCNYDQSSNIDDGTCEYSLTMTLQTDSWPSETSWHISDANGEWVAANTPLTNSHELYVDVFCLQEGCYSLVVNDSYGDGLYDYGGYDGFYLLTDNAGDTLAQWDGEYFSQVIHEFCLPSPEVLGCTDPAYLEFDPSATVDDGSCATLAVEGCTDETASNFNPDANSDNGCCDYSTSGCTPVTFDGHTYGVVEIGTQCWFAENLRTTVYADGETIPANLSDAQWTSTTSGATTVYGEGSSGCSGDCDEVANLEAYGRLYNWYAVDDSRGLCPTGWHVPTDAEWMTLEMELGMSSSEANSTGWRGTDEGKKLKASPQDSPSWNGYDCGDPLNSGFSALPGGLRNPYENDHDFGYGGDGGDWWSASRKGTTLLAWSRFIHSSVDLVIRGDSDQRYGLSVRCLRDE